MLRFIISLLGVYALLLAVHFLLNLFVDVRPRWMDVLDRVCQPGISIGRKAAAKLFPGNKNDARVGEITAFVLCCLVRIVLGFFR